jgi:hypothetical protein
MTLFSSKKSLVQVCILIVIVGFPSASFSKTVGVNVITEINGKVSVEKKQWKKSQPAFIGLTLNLDDKLDLPANASVMVLCSNGQTWTFKAGQHTVSSGCPAGNSVIRLPNSNSDTLRPTGKTEEALSRLPYLITPRQTYILTNRPRLQWNTVPGATKYTVKIDGVNWEMKTSNSEIVYPGEFPLEEGRRYRVTVEADDGSSSLSDRVVGFNLLDKQTKNSILNVVKSVHQQSLSPEAKDLVLAYLYRGFGLYPDAIERLEDLVNQGSQNAVTYQLLGDAYLEIELPQLAKEPYENALRLSKDNLFKQATIEESLGNTYRLLGNEGDSIQLLKKAKASFEQLGDTLKVQKLNKMLNK